MKKIISIFYFLIITNLCLSQTLYIFGGEKHDEFLGILNSSDFDSQSIWNEYSTYGNNFSQKSIWNKYGKYGNEYSLYSPFSFLAQYPPIIVDKEGNFYGYFTINKTKKNRADFDLVEIIYEYHTLIRENVNEWYNKIFN